MQSITAHPARSHPIEQIQGPVSVLIYQIPLIERDALHVRYADVDAETGVIIHFSMNYQWPNPFVFAPLLRYAISYWSALARMTARFIMIDPLACSRGH